MNWEQSCRQYYIELCNQIVKRIDFDDVTLIAMETINPNSLGRSLSPLMVLYPNIVGNLDIEEIDSEWRTLLCDSNKHKSNDLEDFWQSLFFAKNGLNEPMYKKFKIFFSFNPLITPQQRNR